MSFTQWTSMGILACPGGRQFSNEIIGHLKKIYSKKFNKKAALLAKRYSMDKEEVVRLINLTTDFRASSFSFPGAVSSYRPPNFKVDADFTRFANGEFKAEILSSIRGMDLYIVQDVENTRPQGFKNSDEEYRLSVNDHIFCLFVTIDAALQAGANTITLVLPAYPYARQHKKKGREGLTASRLGQLLEFSGVDRIITLDIHSRDTENSFKRLRLENLHASYQILKKLNDITDLDDPELVVAAPDTGSVERNKFYASSIHKPLALLYKERDYAKISTAAHDTNITGMRLLGSIKGKTVFMADDMLGTGGTFIEALKLLKEEGAKQVICAVSLPLFTGEAVEHFEKAYREGLFYRIIGTNAVTHQDDLLNREWYVCAKVSQLFARIISRLHHNQSLSALLDNRKIIQNLLDRKK